MDQERFDALAQSLVSAGSRRRALGALLAGMLGSLGFGHSDAAAAKKRRAGPSVVSASAARRANVARPKGARTRVKRPQLSANKQNGA